MKYCSKCGREVHDEAVVCVHCGCPIQDNRGSRKEAILLKEFTDKVRSVYVFSILGLVLSLGIGIVFMFISEFKRSNISIPVRQGLSAQELADLETAEKNLKTAKALNTATVFILVIGIVITSIIVAASM